MYSKKKLKNWTECTKNSFLISSNCWQNVLFFEVGGVNVLKECCIYKYNNYVYGGCLKKKCNKKMKQ